MIKFIPGGRVECKNSTNISNGLKSLQTRGKSPWNVICAHYNLSPQSTTTQQLVQISGKKNWTELIAEFTP